MTEWRKIGRTPKLHGELTAWFSNDPELTQGQTESIIKVLQGEQDTDTLTEAELKWLENRVNTLVTRKLIDDHLESGGAVSYSSSVH